MLIIERGIENAKENNMKKKYKLSNKEIQYIEIALYDELNFDYVSIKTSTIRKLYELYKDYMRLALEKDDLEIELNKLKRGGINE